MSETPKHYDMEIQPIEYIIKNRLGFCEANIVKYVSRYEDKGGLSDLRKARHYLDMLIDQWIEDYGDPEAKSNYPTTAEILAKLEQEKQDKINANKLWPDIIEKDKAGELTGTIPEEEVKKVTPQDFINPDFFTHYGVKNH